MLFVPVSEQHQVPYIPSASFHAKPSFLSFTPSTLQSSQGRSTLNMVSSSLNLRFYASIILLFGIHANAQVTGEGGAPFGTNTETVPAPSITVSVAPSGSRPTNYYSSVHPQITLPRYTHNIWAHGYRPDFCIGSTVPASPAVDSDPALVQIRGTQLA